MIFGGGLQLPAHSTNWRSDSRFGASRAHSTPLEQLTASCQGRRGQGCVRTGSIRCFFIPAVNGHPKPDARRGRFREPRRCAGCGERGWRAAGRSNAGAPSGHTADRACAAAKPASRCQRRALLPAVSRASYSHTNAARWPARLAPQCHVVMYPMQQRPPMPFPCPMQPHGPVIVSGQRRFMSASTACDTLTCIPPWFKSCAQVGWCGVGPPHPYPAPPPSRLGPAVAEPILHALYSILHI
jgi:hypothetical protein